MRHAHTKRHLAALLCLLGILGGTSGAQAAYFEFEPAEAPTHPGLTEVGDHLYMSPQGDDAADGSFDAPVRTLGAALSLAYAGPPDTPATIWLRGGEYLVEETITRGGDMARDVTVRAYPDETPVITGSVPAENWMAVNHLGGTVWATYCDSPAVRTLYGEDGARGVSRWPKEGMLQVARGTGGTDKFQAVTSFTAAPYTLPASLDGAYVRLVHWWKDELSSVSAYDAQTGTILMSRPTAMTVVTGDGFWLENVLDAPLLPGEWAFDARTRTLLYAPLPGEIIGQTQLYIGVTETLLDIAGASGLTFDGITFARTDWQIPHGDVQADFPQAAYDAASAIHIRDAREVTFARCTFEDIGAGALRLGVNVQGALIYGCTFRNVGAQAVYIHGENAPFAELATENITIENNEIGGYGRNFLNAAAVLVIHARNVSIVHNEIHDGTYTAISVGWVWGDAFSVTNSIYIRGNWLYHIGQQLLSDMGAIYMLGPQPNTFVSGNIIHDVADGGYGGWGIYLDEGADGIYVTNNLVYRCTAQGVHQHSGGHNTVQNNVLAFNHDGQVGASGTGSMLLAHNLLAGGEPYIKAPDTVSIQREGNLTWPDETIFVDAVGGNYNVLNLPEVLGSAFIPWVYDAGRYDEGAR